MSATRIHLYIERLSNLLRAELRKAGAGLGLQPVQIEALHYLSRCNRYSNTPMGVSEFLGQTKGTISQSLNILQRKNLVSKRADAGDGRVTHLEITPQGWQFLAAAIPGEALNAASSKLGIAAESSIVAALGDLLRALQQANQLKSFGVCHTCHYHRRLGASEFQCGLTGEALSDPETRLICREHA